MKHGPALVVLAALTLLVFTLPCSAKTVYVKYDSPGPFDGTTWIRAYHTVQAGLNASVSGDQVWVARGTYVERITLKAGVALYGGYSGSGTTRDIATYVTILDGSQGGSVVTSPSGASSTTRIDGFTIRNGRGYNGGGLYCNGSAPTIANNIITGNSAYQDEGGGGGWGGGVYCSGSATITTNTITGNSGSPGGGIYCNSSPTITNNKITKNTSGMGAGIYCDDTSSPTVSNNIISENIGDGILAVAASGSITNNTITGNCAGRGINGYGHVPNTLAISNNIVAFNESGVAIAGSGDKPALRNNCIYGNTSSNYSGVLAGEGDISLDPLLADMAYGNLHIQPTSPCRNTGWGSAPGIGATDIDGQARVQDLAVDMGADESDGATWAVGPYVIVRVSLSGNDANSGSSWAAAKKTVQAATDAASALGGEVWVKAGTYNERVVVRSHTYIYGGFAGTETAKAERSWTANKTILDGGAGGSVVAVSEGYGRMSAIDGFTIRNGTGSGIFCQYSSPAIANNTITSNTASKGGGISCLYSSPAITGNTIIGNNTTGLAESSGGGGISCDHASPMIANNTIRGNSATGSGSRGGGINCYYSSPTIANNLVVGNTANTHYGGGIACYRASATIVNNTIVGNSSHLSGGGIACCEIGSPTLSNNLVAFNSSGVYKNAASTPTLRSNCVYGNRTFDYSGLSAGVGDISLDPLLADVAYGNAHIQPGSPCRDAGYDAAVGAGWLDIDGEDRVEGVHVDIGADESYDDTWAAGPYTTVRVSPSGNDANDGSSWALAKKTVQAAIDAASALGGEVWVKAGAFAERITLHPYAYVYGGFGGTEILRSERDWRANRTILDGGAAGCVVSVTSGYRASALDGFTVRNGKAATYASGINCLCASPTIANNAILGNRGTAMSCYYRAAPIIVNNIMAGNDGHGVHSSNASSPTITNNVIGWNRSYGVYCVSSSTPAVSNNIIAFNYYGVIVSSSTPVLRNNCVYGNTSSNYSAISAGEGDISVDPLLAAPLYGNFHIQPASPCRNAGWNDAAALPATDMDDQARVQNEIVDIGADESDGNPHASGPSIVVRVSLSGSDTNDGSSWVSAKRTVQAGIDAASGGEVWVKSGTYDERIVLHPYTYLYGGFAGTESASSQRSWTANQTILDGGAGGSVVSIYGGAPYQVSAVDGFTIRNGTGTVLYGTRYGGGIYCDNSSPAIANNTITGNDVLSGQGGGIYCDDSSPTITTNVISGNTRSTYGSAISLASSSGTITDNIISGNGMAYYGGGIYCFASSPMITNNTIAGNTATYGGGISLDSGSPVLSNNIVAFNTPGVYKGSGGGTPVLRNNDVYGNTSYNYSGISAGVGDISIGPLLVNYPGGDYHLTATSPCRNAGWNDAAGLPSTDMDGEGRISGLTVDIGADEYWMTSARPSVAKALGDGTERSLKGFGVSAAFDGFFYIEAADRNSGIRVDKANHGVHAGDKVTVSGTLATNSDCERFIQASAVVPSGIGLVEALLLPNRSIGGGDWLYDPLTGAGQRGQTDVAHLTNIGLLVSTTGKVTHTDTGFFYLDDGSMLDDGSGYIGVQVTTEGLSMPAFDSYVKVTGVSSCYRAGSDLFRLIRATKIEAIIP